MSTQRELTSETQQPSTPEIDNFLEELPYTINSLARETGVDELVKGIEVNVHLRLVEQVERVEIHFVI